MSKVYDVVVVGMGAMGTAACHHLAKRGASVLGLEKFDVPHALGSSHGFSRAIRSAYKEHPDYVPLLRSSFALWRQLEAESDQKVLHTVGALYMGPIERKSVAHALSAAQQYNLPYELLDRATLGRRYPQFHVPDDFVGMLEHEAGFLEPEKAVAAHALCAMRAGAEIHGREAVTGWSSDKTGVTVKTERGSYRAKRIVFSSGAWSDRLVTDLGVPLRVSRQVLAWFWPKNPEAFGPGKIPVWTIDNLDEQGSTHYGFPMMPDNPGFKIARHYYAATANPDTVERRPLPGDEEDVRKVLQTRIPDADGPLLSLRVCLYTNTPDLNFIIDRHPQDDRVVVACGFSGHGFKFASVVGQILSDLGTDGRTNHPVGFLGLSRFA